MSQRRYVPFFSKGSHSLLYNTLRLRYVFTSWIKLSFNCVLVKAKVSSQSRLWRLYFLIFLNCQLEDCILSETRFCWQTIRHTLFRILMLVGKPILLLFMLLSGRINYEDRDEDQWIWFGKGPSLPTGAPQGPSKETKRGALAAWNPSLSQKCILKTSTERWKYIHNSPQLSWS